MNGYAKAGIALLVAAGVGTLIYLGIRKKADKIGTSGGDTSKTPGTDKTPIHTGLNDFKGQSSVPPPPASNEGLPLDIGMNGPNVKKLQTALINVWNRGDVGFSDGAFGPKTKGAVLAIGYSLPISREDFNNIIAGKQKGATNRQPRYSVNDQIYARKDTLGFNPADPTATRTFPAGSFIGEVQSVDASGKTIYYLAKTSTGSLWSVAETYLK